VPYTLVPSGQQITWGSWSALDVANGNILWQTADPTAGTIDTGSVSVANGVMYAGSFSGQMYALDTTTGKILWNFASGGSVIDGPSIVDGTLYWGSGYRISHWNRKQQSLRVHSGRLEGSRRALRTIRTTTTTPTITTSKSDRLGVVASIKDVSCDFRSR